MHFFNVNFPLTYFYLKVQLQIKCFVNKLLFIIDISKYEFGISSKLL